MPWYDVRKQELVISDDSRKRILALMKEISECMRNFGVNAEQLGKTLREFAMAVKPGNTPDGKPSGTVVREPRTYEYMVATEGNGALVSAR